MDPSYPPSATARRAAAIARHLAGLSPRDAAAVAAALEPSACLSYAPPESSEPAPAFSPLELRSLLDRHHLRERDWAFRAMEESPLFCQRRSGGKVFVSPDYNEGKEGQREATMRRVGYLARRGVFRGWLTEPGPDAELRKLALLECLGMYDHSLAIKIGVHFFLWYVPLAPNFVSNSPIPSSHYIANPQFRAQFPVLSSAMAVFLVR
jgi:acyl-CoA oxidase